MSKKLVLPEVITALLKAQNEYNSSAYSELFATNAIVHDEGKTYNGRPEIKNWNEATNKKYSIKLEPTEFLAEEKQRVLSAMMSGNFDGSPAPVKYNFTFENEIIKTLNLG